MSTVQFGGLFRYRNYGTLSDPPWNYINTSILRTEGVTYGVNRADWKSRIRQRLSATTTLSGVRYKYEQALVSASFQWVHKTNPGLIDNVDFSGDFFGQYLQVPGSASTISLDKANDTALRRLNSKILATQRSFQTLPFIGELGEAIRMIRNPLKILWKGQFDFMVRFSEKRRWHRGKDPYEIHNRVAEAWLETVFGWQPFIGDIEDAIVALSKFRDVYPPHVNVVGSATDNRVGSSISFPLSPIGTVNPGGKRWSSDEASVRYKACIALAQPSIRTELHRYGISWRDITPAVWELIPFSFLADYFTNIGAIIDAASINLASVRWIEKGTSVTARSFVSFSSSIAPKGSDYVLTRNFCSCAGVTSASRTDVNRVDYSGQSLIPPLRFQIPGLSTKWLNMAALLLTHKRTAHSVYH